MTTTSTNSPPIQAPLTDAALRSLLWGGAQSRQPVPGSAEQLDDLTLAKIRLLEMRRPHQSATAAILHNPIPIAVGAFALGAIVSRSKLARMALTWAGARVAGTAFKQTAKSLASRQVRSNGRANGRWNGRRKPQPAGWAGKLAAALMKSGS